MSTEQTPLTLALVAYEKADVIGLVIESAAAGSVPPDLVVVSDDGSADGTADVAEQACREAGLPHRILRHPRVGDYRLQTMRNSAVAAALEGVILLSDSDCIFAENTLAAHLAIHREFTTAVGTGTRFEYLEGTSGEFTSMYSTLECAHAPRSNYMMPFGANLSFTRRLWRDLGGFDRAYEGYYGFDDHEFVLRAARAGTTIYSDPAAYLFHCPHDTSFHGRQSRRNELLFDSSFGLNFEGDEIRFIRGYVTPSYWSGHRKSSLLGKPQQLDEWGAPPGYHRPLHLELMKSTSRLVPHVERLCRSPSEANRTPLVDIVMRVQLYRMLPHSAGEHLVSFLRRVLARTDVHSRKGRAEIRRLLDRWLRWQAAIDHPAEVAQWVNYTPALRELSSVS